MIENLAANAFSKVSDHFETIYITKLRPMNTRMKRARSINIVQVIYGCILRGIWTCGANYFFKINRSLLVPFIQKITQYFFEINLQKLTFVQGLF